MSIEPTFPPLTTEGLTVFAKTGNGFLRIMLAGAVEMRDPGELLNPYWSHIDEEVRRLGLQRVEIDVRDLNFMNSSGLLTLVRWITKAKAHTTGAYHMTLKYDRNVTWQRASIPTLAKLAPEIVTAADSNG
jgi:hypothetical protein